MRTSTTALRLLGLTVALAAAAACGGGDGDPTGPAPAPSTYSILGAWNYTEGAATSARDRGVITFTGSPAAGNYTLRNFYDVEYLGTFAVTDSVIRLQGNKRWTATFADANSITGTWEATEGGLPVSGPLSLVRR